MNTVMNARAVSQNDAIPEEILDEAAYWLMELHSGELKGNRHQELKDWCARSADHERAWQRATLFSEKMHGLPVAGAKALKQLSGAGRRKAVKTIAALLVAAPAGWLTYRQMVEGADDRYRTAVGEQRKITLADGSQIVLNTNTEIGVMFNESQRLIELRHGEILVTTAKDSLPVSRPFSVRLSQGTLRALGTVFTARQEKGKGHVAVMEGAVEINPADNQGSRQVIPSSWQSSFTNEEIDTPEKLDAGANSWVDGMLIVHKMPLGRFIAELNRYRSGVLRYDAEVAKLPISGAFSIRDTDQTLEVLAQTMPVRIDYMTRYWVTVVPK